MRAIRRRKGETEAEATVRAMDVATKEGVDVCVMKRFRGPMNLDVWIFAGCAKTDGTYVSWVAD